MSKMELRDHTVTRETGSLHSGAHARNQAVKNEKFGERPPDSSIEVPHWGNVPAGALVETGDRNQTRVSIDLARLRKPRIQPMHQAASAMQGDENIFALSVRGDSMIEAGICDGDLVLFRRTSEASPGQIAVVMVGGEATLKRVFVKGVQTELRPCNRELASIWVETRHVLIKGVLVGIVPKAA